MKEVIEILKDSEQYYSGVGKNYLSNSDIGTLLNNPKDFGVERPDTLNFAKGRLFHQLILEPKVAKKVRHLDISSRNTKMYREYIKGINLDHPNNYNDDFILLTKEVEEIQELVKIMLANMDFFDLIHEKGNKFEQPSVKEIKGVLWKGRADIVNEHILVDLKTTSDINKFKWSAKKYNYDSQAYIYQELFGKPLIFLVIDKATELLGMFEPSVEFIERGEKKVEQAIEIYNTFFCKNAPESIDNYYINEQLT